MDQAIPDTALTLFRGSCDFMLGMARLDQLPLSDLPEVAFAGRSNVGKSSLLNALTGRSALARTSHTPGRTQQLNFFDLGGKLRLVDMPGYGYAKVSKTQRKDWNKLIRDYLRGRVNLRAVYVLVDGRHGLKDSDTEMMKMLDESAVPYRIILTKADKVHESEMTPRIEDLKVTLKKYSAAYPEPILTSSHKDRGLDDVQRNILFSCGIEGV